MRLKTCQDTHNLQNVQQDCRENRFKRISEKSILSDFLVFLPFGSPLLAILRMFEGWVYSFSSFTTPALDYMCYPRQNNMILHIKSWYPTDHGVPRMVPRGSQYGSCSHNKIPPNPSFASFGAILSSKPKESILEG